MKLPNILTLIRLLFIPIIGFCLYSENSTYILVAVFLFMLACLTDWADGYIARNYKMSSAFGTFMDPIVDKMLILSMLFIFADLKLIPLWIVLLILFREFLVTGVRQICSTPKKIIGANWMGKSKFILQTLLIIYLTLVLYYNNQSEIFNTQIGFWFALFVAFISLAFAINFVYWHKVELLKGV